jgi:hypothetical protein
MKRSLALLISMLLGAVFLVSTGPAATAAPYCGIYWGSLAETRSLYSSTATIANVRSGEHTCYDRLVIDVRGDIRGYDVRYVDVTRQDGSGFAVPVRGAADLRIRALVPAYDSAGQPTYTPANRSELVNVTGYSTFRQVAWAGSFEGRTTIALGVRARLPFRVFILDGPGTGSRLVIDVAHRW